MEKISTGPHQKRILEHILTLLVNMVVNYFSGNIMINEVNAVTFRQNLGDMLNQVQYRHDSIFFKKDGKPVFALIDAQLFDRICRFKERFDNFSRKIAEAL